MAEFVAYVKANPGKVNWGSSGLGTITQLYGEMLNLEAGIKMVHVPYKGSAQATQDLLSGQVQVQFDSTVLPHIMAGRLRGLAMLADTRWPHKPEIPTLKETGYGKQGGDSWFGILAPAGMPAPIVTRMSQAIDEALQVARRARQARQGRPQGDLSRPGGDAHPDRHREQATSPTSSSAGTLR